MTEASFGCKVKKPFARKIDASKKMTPPPRYQKLGFSITAEITNKTTRVAAATNPWGTPMIASASAKGAEIDDHWTDITNDVEKYYTLSGGNDTSSVSCDLQEVFEEKSRQPMNAPTFERLNSGFQGGNHTKFNFQVDAHMVVYGEADPQAIVTIGGEPVRLQNDGSFVLRLDMPDRRQVLPVVASSRDGTQQRTTVLAVERNTKVMEPVTNQFE